MSNLTETEIIKKNQIEILELKNAMNEMKNVTESTSVRLDQAEERICEVEHSSLQIIQSEE